MRKRYLVVCLLMTSLSPALAGKVTIKVVDPHGKPMPGVQVVIAPSMSCPLLTQATPRTDKSGTYTRDVTGKACAYAYCPGFVQAYAPVHSGENVIKLEPAGQATGSVVDESGKPVVGVTVRIASVTRPDGTRFSPG